MIMRIAGSVGLPVALMMLSLLLTDCRGLRRAPDQMATQAPHSALRQLVTGWAFEDTVTVLGFRDRWGKKQAGADLLEAALLSALGQQQVVVHPDAGIMSQAPVTMRFRQGGILPDDWRDLTGPAPRRGLVLGAQVREADAWLYLRLALADAATGELVEQGMTRISQARLDELLAVANSDSAAVLKPFDVDYHVLVRREDAGFVEKIEVEEGATLIEGDRLQVRIRTAQDCEVFAFLYASKTGERRDLVGPTRVYADRWNYGPAENSWSRLEGDEVYTLYLLVASRLSEDRRRLWENIGQWQQQGSIDRLQGLDLIDGALGEYLQEGVSGVDSVTVLRGAAGITRADKAETFAYQDGAVFESYAQQLRQSVILRAISFSVRWE